MRNNPTPKYLAAPTELAVPVSYGSVEKVLLLCAGGQVVSPATILCDRADGGHLVVNPPRPVWERNCLSPNELALWSLLVAATGQAMLDELPQLADSCLNYWEAGNWALNEQAQPLGRKNVQESRRVHLHIFGRSRNANHPDWQWGESPRFPPYALRLAWTSHQRPLSKQECDAIGRRCESLFTSYQASLAQKP